MKVHWGFFSRPISERIRGQLTGAVVDAKTTRGEDELVSFNSLLSQSTTDRDILTENMTLTIELFSSPINFNAGRTFASSINRSPWMRKNFIKLILMLIDIDLYKSVSENNDFSISAKVLRN